MDVNWPQIVFSERFYEKLKHKVSQKIFNPEDAEEGVLFVIEKLAEDDWARCKKFNGDSKPETYLYVVVQRLIGDFHRKTYGRKRPPVWLKEKGDLWVLIWKELCLNREHPEALLRKLCDVNARNSRDPSIVQSAIRVIKGKLPWCGVSEPPKQEIIDDALGLDAGPDSDYEQAFLEGVLEICDLVLKGESPDDLIATLKSIGPDGIDSLLDDLQLTAEELLILRMHFVDGLKFAQITRDLKISSSNYVRQKVTAVLTKLRQCLELLGVDSARVEPGLD